MQISCGDDSETGDEDEEVEELGLKDRESLIILFQDEKRSLAKFQT